MPDERARLRSARRNAGRSRPLDRRKRGGGGCPPLQHLQCPRTGRTQGQRQDRLYEEAQSAPPRPGDRRARLHGSAARRPAARRAAAPRFRARHRPASHARPPDRIDPRRPPSRRQHPGVRRRAHLDGEPLPRGQRCGTGVRPDRHHPRLQPFLQLLHRSVRARPRSEPRAGGCPRRGARTGRFGREGDSAARPERRRLRARRQHQPAAAGLLPLRRSSGGAGPDSGTSAHPLHLALRELLQRPAYRSDCGEPDGLPQHPPAAAVRFRPGAARNEPPVHCGKLL